MNETDRGMWRLVARRDFWVRLRERSFVISTLINVAVISVLIGFQAFGSGDGPGELTLAVGRDDPAAEELASFAASLDGVVDVAPSADDEAAREAVRSGKADAAFLDGRLVVQTTAPAALSQLVQQFTALSRQDGILDRYGVTPDDREALRAVPPLEVIALEPGDPNRDQNAAIAFVGILLLYGQLFGYGVWVASGVIEEKASRVVEILLATMRARQLMAGKIVGIGMLGLAQLALIGGFAVVLALVTGVIDLPVTALRAVALDLGFFVLGFAFYASLFAVAGALVSRMEELQNVLVPVNLVIFISFFVSVGATSDPDGTVVRVASILPTSSAMAMPVRILLGAASPWEIALAVGLSLGGTLALIPLAGRMYSGAVLQTGSRVKLRQAWRSAAA